MSEKIKEILEDVKRHIDYLDTTNQSSIRDNEMRVMYYEIERLNSIIKEVREYIEENTNSDSFTELTSGKITDIGYCIVAFEDILEILDKVDKDV